MQKLSGRLVPLVLLVLSPALTCQRRGRPRHRSDDEAPPLPTLRATESVPPWVALLIAEWSLEPADRQPYEVWRYQYRGADAYYIPPRCCDIPAAIYDTNGTFLGTGVGGFSGSGQLRDFPETGGTLLWQSDPSTQGPAAAQAVLRDPRFAREPALLAFARLEVDTGVAWEGGLVMGPGLWPTSLRASGAPLGTARAGRTLEQAAMDFLVRYRDLFGMVDPANELVSMPVDRHLFPRGVSFQQKVHSVLVECPFTNVDLDERGSLVEVQNGYEKDLRKFDTTPTLDAAAAAAAAGAEVHRRQPTPRSPGCSLALWSSTLAARPNRTSGTMVSSASTSAMPACNKSSTS